MQHFFQSRGNRDFDVLVTSKNTFALHARVFRDNLCKRQFVRDAEFSGATDPCITENPISISCQELMIAALASHSKTTENNAS